MLEALAKIDVLRSLPPSGLERLAQMARLRTFAAGEALMRQGEASESVHFIARGRVRVERELPGYEPIMLADLGAGDTVGERGVLYCEPRSATVTALEETETIELDTRALAMIGLHYPDVAQTLVAIVGLRQRATAIRERQARSRTTQRAARAR